MINLTITEHGARNSAPLFTGTFQVLERFGTLETLTAIVYSFQRGDVQTIASMVNDILKNIDTLGGYVEKHLGTFCLVFSLPGCTKPEYLQAVLDATERGVTRMTITEFC